MESAISTFNLTKCYGDQTAVDRLSLHVGRGEIYGFLGLNGAGKTTTIRMLLGMIRPSEGNALIFGKAAQPDARDLWARVGYLVETPSAYPELTVRENLEIVRRLRRIADPRAIDRTIDRLALTPYANQRAATLSLGNVQRLGLAKALLHNPDLLILDEPANGLDPAGVVEIRELLHDLAHRQGITVFMSSHILGEVARLATRIGILHQGRLIQELNAQELESRRHRWLVVDARDRDAARSILSATGLTVTTQPDGSLVVTDERATTLPDDIARLLVEADVSLTRLSVEQEDLETYFLRMVGVEKGVETGVEKGGVA
ncbi:MAG TPA: ABC transporter ATP-binding protein [Ktedonobacterales bacterium]